MGRAFVIIMGEVGGGAILKSFKSGRLRVHFSRQGNLEAGCRGCIYFFRVILNS